MYKMMHKASTVGYFHLNCAVIQTLNTHHISYPFNEVVNKVENICDIFKL